MKMPRFRIAWVMVAVAIAALDFAAIRALFGFRGVTYCYWVPCRWRTSWQSAS